MNLQNSNNSGIHRQLQRAEAGFSSLIRDYVGGFSGPIRPVAISLCKQLASEWAKSQRDVPLAYDPNQVNGFEREIARSYWRKRYELNRYQINAAANCKESAARSG